MKENKINKKTDNSLNNQEKDATVSVDRVRIRKLVEEFPGLRKNLIADSQISPRTFDRLVNTKIKSKVNRKSLENLAKALNVPVGDLVTGEDIGPSVANLTYRDSFVGHPGLNSEDYVNKFYNCKITNENTHLFETIYEFMYRTKMSRKFRDKKGAEEIINSEMNFIKSLAEPNTALSELEKQGIRMYTGTYDVFYMKQWDMFEPEQRKKRDYDPDVDDEDWEIINHKYINIYPVYANVKIIAFFESKADSIQVKVNNGYGSSKIAINTYRDFVEKNIKDEKLKKINNYDMINETLNELGVYNNSTNHIENLHHPGYGYNFFSTHPKTKLKLPEFLQDTIFPKKAFFNNDEYREIKKKEETMK